MEVLRVEIQRLPYEQASLMCKLLPVIKEINNAHDLFPA